MASRIFDIITRFRIFSSDGLREMARLGAGARILDQQISAVSRRFAGLATSALGVAGIGGLGYGMVRLSKGMVGLNSQLESAQIGMAVLLQQASANGGPFASWNSALGQSKQLIEDLRERAARLPGTTDEFVQAMQTLLTMAPQTGGKLSQYKDLAQNALISAKVGNVIGGVDVVARDIRQVMSGTATAAMISTPQLKGPLKELLKVAKKNKLEALTAISKALEIGPDALAAYEKTLEAQFSTAKDNAAALVRELGKPVFEAAVDAARRLNTWYKDNKEQVNATARAIGGNIVAGLKRAGRFAKDIYDNFESIKTVALYLAETVIAVKLVAALGAAATAINGAGGLLAAMKMVASQAFAIVGALAAIETARRLYELNDVLNQPDTRDYAAGRGFTVESVRDFRGRVALSERTDIDEINRRRKEAGDSPLAGMSKRDKNILRLAYQQKYVGVFGSAPGEVSPATMAQALSDQEIRNAMQEAARQGATGKSVSPWELLKTAYTKQPEAADPHLGDGNNTHIDARGSTFRIEQNLPDGDPDRIAIAVRQGIMAPFVPMIASMRGPRL